MMMDIVKLIVIAGISYLVGAIPTAFIFGKFLKGIDIRQHGSGNVGATNAFRVLGKGWGITVLILDIVKGIVPVVCVAGLIFPDVIGRITASLAAVSGHNWTCFLNFKGGKGIATTLGVMIGLTVTIPEVRWPVALCVLAWTACFVATAYVSVSSLIAAVALPIAMVTFSAPTPVVLLSILFCVFVVFRHKPNIHRFLNGQEPKVPLPWNKAKE
ncbi:MAG: glycerol-3-phosphate 1-O-acyltransferase PlsY [Candidatus Omnitrophica bacterium]|nr:glycerol-3-phosphate 1-O-acyltransferase PlsY [Candidatus Omnitrophota bacterium]